MRPDLPRTEVSRSSFLKDIQTEMLMIFFFITHADNGRVNKAFSPVCASDVCVCVRTIESKRLKLQSPNLPQGIMSSGYQFKSKGQRSRSQGHKVQKYFRRSSGRREFALYRVPVL